MMPLAKFAGGTIVPLDKFYERIITKTVIENETDSQVLKDAKKKKRDRIFGEDIFHAFTPIYLDISHFYSVGINFRDWERLSLSQKGKLIAYKDIEKMIEVIRAIERDEDYKE